MKPKTIVIISIIVLVVSLSLFLEYGIGDSGNQETNVPYVTEEPTQTPYVVEPTEPPGVMEYIPALTSYPPPRPANTPWPYDEDPPRTQWPTATMPPDWFADTAYFNNCDYITFQAEEAVHRVGTQWIAIIRTNHTNYSMGSGINYRVQRLNGDEWVLFDYVFNGLLVRHILPNSSNIVWVNLSRLQQSLSVGRYRVIMPIRHNNYFAAEFELID